jgi:hypothetical protein
VNDLAVAAPVRFASMFVVPTIREFMRRYQPDRCASELWGGSRSAAWLQAFSADWQRHWLFSMVRIGLVCAE